MSRLFWERTQKKVWGWEQSAQDKLENQWNFEKDWYEKAIVNLYNLSEGNKIISQNGTYHWSPKKGIINKHMIACLKNYNAWMIESETS